MARYRMDDGTVVDTDRATRSWDEERDFDGHNRIGRLSGDQWTSQTLYRSRRGRYYVVHESQWAGSRAHAEWVSPEEATRWLLANGADPDGDDFPADLRGHIETVSE